jgi:DNA-binding CsgD family transcriptional regulator
MNHQISAVISRIGNGDFFSSLLQILGARIPFDIGEIYTLSPQSMSGVVHYQRNPNFILTFPGYADSYSQDPLYRAYRDGLPAGLYKPSDLEKKYPQARSYLKTYETTQVGEELEYLVPVATDLALVIYLSRSSHSEAFRRNSVADLFKYQAPIIASVQKHCSLNTLTNPVSAVPSHEAMAVGGKQCLTFREVQIVESILSGKCAKATAQQLGIAEGTVRIHRKNIFRKLNVHSQAELFAVASRPSLSNLVHRAAPL